MSDPIEADATELTDEEIEKIWSDAPPAVRAEIDAELDSQMSEMMKQFEEHAAEYEKEHPETAPKK